ncbi:MAG: hypothetical protein C0616_01155 [Desulfuromonas sp.]|nr:MAG: hypothetical protein C0616_01155 [Desulfuromonas sp.]
MKSYQNLLDEGMKAVEKGDALTGLLLFEEASKHQLTPTIQSCLGYCLAAEKGKIREGIELCQQAKRKEPERSLHYLNLGRIYMLAGQKQFAIKIFRQGMRMEANRTIMRELEYLGLRREPVFHRLDRNHPLNRHFGKFMAAIGMR